MCGIFGITRFNSGDLPIARRALTTLSHRGPDGWGEWHDKQVYLGHRRLSIIDLSERGRQPMVAPGNDPVALTVNGEIYNFRELRDSLRHDQVFASDSDSEVLLHGYRQWGIEGLVSRIEGMFAFAIYDSALGRLFLCRDRVGIKPLFYGVFDQQVVWASELKAIVDYAGDALPDIEPTAVYDFLNYGYIPSPKTLYKDVFKLPPATYLSIDVATGRVSTSRYWALEPALSLPPPSDSCAAVRARISASVADQMVSDAPLGVFLSGGIDSSIVAAEANVAVENLVTFGAYFGEDENQDLKHSTLVASALGTSHIIEHIPQLDVAECMPLLGQWVDEPFADFSFFPTLKICELAAKHVKVALSGDGGDELFGGYKWYWNSALTQRRHRCFRRAARLACALPTFGLHVGRSLRYRLHNRMLDQLTLYARLLGGLDEAAKRRYREQLAVPGDYDDLWHFRKHYRPELPTVTRFQYLDFHSFLCDDVLTKVDRASMAVSLEVRVPFLDRHVIETAFSIPDVSRLEPHGAKSVLKQAYAGTVPDAVLHRRKVGFGVPRTTWARTGDLHRLSGRERVLKHAFGHLGIVRSGA